MKTPLVTIVGRPNTGKSTLFNKLIGQRMAIESPEAGTTRDRIFHKIKHPEIDFFLVDTGGLQFGKESSSIEGDLRAQAKLAIEEADVILFMVEGSQEPTRDDLRLAEYLRKKIGKKPLLLLAGKCDEPLEPSELASLYRLGLGDPFPVSAMHRRGLEFLLKAIVESLKKRDFPVKGSARYKKARKDEENQLNIALAGKPNVGKSSLVNAFLNQNRLIVSEIPGTTRDATDTQVRHEGKFYNFIDTAGLRRKNRVEQGIEAFSVLRSLTSIERADVVLLVLDSSQPISDQDQQIVHFIMKAGKGLILLMNKWDLKTEEESDEEHREKTLQELQRHFAFIPWAPVVFTSAKTKKNFAALFLQIETVQQERSKRIKTPLLNRFVQKLSEEHVMRGPGSTFPKIFYITQIEVNPPHFVVFINRKKNFHFSTFRFLENKLREQFGFQGTPLEIEYRERRKD